MLLTKISRLFPFLPIIIFISLAALITHGWYSNGFLLGGAEVGIFGLNPSRFLEIQQFIWWGAVAPGMLVPQFVIGVPIYFLLSILQPIFDPLILQIIISFILLFVMGYGMYIFARSYLGWKKSKYAIIAAIFYMLNSYTMVEVWHRFLYTGFFLASFLPLLGYFWKQWINKGNIISLVLFLLTTLASSYMFGNLTSIITLWIVCWLMSAAEALLPWKDKSNFFKQVIRFILGLAFFLLTNLWWLIPVLTVSTGVLPEQHSSEDNISTLVNISKQTILPFTLQFANPFYLFYQQELGHIYTSFFYMLLSWLPAVVIFIGILASFKNKKLASLGIFYILAIWIAKGAASPLGYPYIWAFMNFYPIGILRNPFEKLGILLPLFGSVLFACGIDIFLIWCSKKMGRFLSKLIIGLIFLSVLIYAWPMFTGKVFDKQDYPLTVKISKSYEQANDWLKLQNSDGNILQLPFPSKDVVTYNWGNGYHGVEINEILFTSNPSITRNVGFQRVDATLSSLGYIFSEPFSKNKDEILRLLQEFNVKYIVLHKDITWNDTSTYGKDIRLINPAEIEASLNGLDYLEKSKVFGDLAIYKLKDNFFQPKVILVGDKNDLLYAGESNILQTLSIPQSSYQVTPLGSEVDKEIISNLSQILIFPEKVLYTWEPSHETLEGLVNQILFDPSNESSPFTQLTEAKDAFFVQTGELLSENLINKMILANNNLVELTKNSLNGTARSTQGTLETYNSLIDSIFAKGFNGSSVQQVIKPLINKVFMLHLYLLDRLYKEDKTQEALKVKIIYDRLNGYLIKNDILPASHLDQNSKQTESFRRTNRFSVSLAGPYELLMTNPASLVLYPDFISKLNVYLDNKNISTKSSKDGNSFNLGEIQLDKGSHEISYEVLPSTNLAADLNKFIFVGNSEKIDNNIRLITNQQGGGAIKINLPPIFGGDIYEITFEGLIDNPREFYIQTSEDTQDARNPYDCTKISCYGVNPNPEIKGWQNFNITVGPTNLASRNASFQILLPAVTSGSSGPSTLQLKNIRINRIMDNNLVLKRKLKDSGMVATASAQLIEVKEITPVRYVGKIKLAKPAFMFFKEAFNPNWKLILSKDGHDYEVDKHYLGNLYGNAYFIEKLGEYDFTLEFTPQRSVNKGIVLSIIGWVGLLALLFYLEFKRRISH